MILRYDTICISIIMDICLYVLHCLYFTLFVKVKSKSNIENEDIKRIEELQKKVLRFQQVSIFTFFTNRIFFSRTTNDELGNYLFCHFKKIEFALFY